MFCQNCGSQNIDEAVFCENCGARLEHDEIPVSSVSAAENIVAVKPRKRMTLWTKILMIEAILFLVVAYALYNEGKNSFTPQNIALTFFVHMANGDFRAAYGELDVEESEFINEDMFVKACSGNRLGTVSNFRAEIEKGEVGEGWNADKQGMLGKTVVIDYRVKGSSVDQTYPLNLVRQMDKKYLLFDVWKVGADDMIAADYSIIVPKGASVTFDGVELNDTYLQGKETEYGVESVCYNIPQIFQGAHSIQVSMENKETITDDVGIWYDNDQYTVWSMDWTQEAMDQMIQEAGADIQQLYQAAMSGQDFDSVSALFSGNIDYADGLQYQYNSLVSLLEEDSGSDAIQTIRFHDLEGAVSSSTANSVDIKGLYDVEAVYTDWWTGERKSKSIQDTYYSGTVSLAFEDGRWVLTSFWLDVIYY